MRRLEPPAVKKGLYNKGKDTPANAGTYTISNTMGFSQKCLRGELG